MERLEFIWNWVVIHKSEIWLAALFALLAAVLIDLVSIDSRIRGRIRELKNKWSEKSVARLQKRIQELENQRNRFTSYLSSDKGLYLWMLGSVIAILLSISLGIAVLIVDRIFMLFGAGLAVRWPYYFLALMMFSLAIGLAIKGLKISSLDTKEKMGEYIAKLDAEIANLKAKLGPL
jgi:hypothetical protein